MKNIPKKTRNGFDNWVGKHFKGLSAFTLVQLLKMETTMVHVYIEDMVYVNFFNKFIGKDTSQETQNAFDFCKNLAESVSWL